MRHSQLRTALHSSNRMVFDMRPYQNMGEPVGDPFGGAAYGEKNSKFFKTVLAVVGVALAIPSGGLTLGAMSLLEGISLAGAALNLVGTVTGNNTLSKIGGFASLGAGLATAFAGKSALWNSLGKSTSGMTEAGGTSLLDTIKATSSVDPTSGVNAFLEGGAAGGTSGLASDAVDMASNAATSGNTSMMQTLASKANVASNPITSAINSSPIPDVVANNVANANNVNNVSELDKLTNSVKVADPSTVKNLANSATEVAQGTLPDITNTGLLGMAKGAGTGVLSFIKDNPVATKLVGDFIQGAYQSPQDKAKAQAYIDYYNQQTDVSKQQQINAQAIPTMNLSANPNASVQFNTAVRAPRGMGLLNRNQQV